MPGAICPFFANLRTRNCGLCGTTRYSRCPISEILSTSNFTESLRPTSNPEKWTAAGRASKKRVLPSRQCISEKLEEVLSGACKGAQICFQSVAAIPYSVNYGDLYISPLNIRIYHISIYIILAGTYGTGEISHCYSDLHFFIIIFSFTPCLGPGFTSI